MNNIASSLAFPYSSDKGSASTISEGNKPPKRIGLDRAKSNQGAKNLTHVNITTGHSYDCPRHQVTDEVIGIIFCWMNSTKPTLIPGIDRKLFAAQIPNHKEYKAALLRAGGCLYVAIFHEKYGPFMTFGVSPSHAEGAPEFDTK